MQTLIIVIALVLLTNWSAPAAFAQGRLPGERFAGELAESRDCVSPECALDAFLACFARRDETLCRAVWPQTPAGPMFTNRAREFAYWWSYRVVRGEFSGADSWEAAVAGRHCGLLSSSPRCTTTPAPPTVYKLGKTARGWSIIEWHTPHN